MLTAQIPPIRDANRVQITDYRLQEIRKAVINLLRRYMPTKTFVSPYRLQGL